MIAVSHRADNNSLRIILGNDRAIVAARAGQTNPWPDGAALGKLVFKDATQSRVPPSTAWLARSRSSDASVGRGGSKHGVGAIEQDLSKGQEAEDQEQQCGGPVHPRLGHTAQDRAAEQDADEGYGP